MVLLLLVLAGPLSLLPLAFIARWWPRTAAASMLAGGLSAIILTLHPFGLRFVAFNLWNEVWPAVVLVSLVPMVFGVLLLLAQPSSLRSSLIAAVLVALVGSVGLTEGTKSWEASLRFRTLHPVTFLAFAPDGEHLLAAYQSGLLMSGVVTVSAIDVRTGKATPIAEATNRHLLTPDRTKLIIARGETLQTDLWDVAKGQASNLGKFYGPMAVSATGLLALTSKGGVQIVDTRTGTRLGALKFESTRWLAFSPDGRTLAVGGSKQIDGQWKSSSDIALWDVSSSTVRTLTGRPEEEALRAQFSPDGTILAILAGKQSNQPGGRLFLRLWSMKEGRELQSLEEAVYGDSAWFTPDSKTLLTSQEDARILQKGPPTSTTSLWDTQTWRRKGTMRGSGEWAWSPDNATIARVEFHEQLGFGVGFWSVADGSRLGEFEVVEFLPGAIAFAPDGKTVAVGGTMRDRQVGNRPGRVAILPFQR